MNDQTQTDLFDEPWPIELEAAYQAFKKIVIKAKRVKGFNQWSAEGALQVLRWETRIGDGGSEYRVNNNNRRTFAVRVLSELGPEFKGFFKFRHPTGSIGLEGCDQ